MWWLLAVALPLAATFFLVGAVCEDEGLALFRSLDRVKYAVSVPERMLAATTGVLLVVILYVLNGMLRVLTFGVGTLAIVTGELAQRMGGTLPRYRSNGSPSEVEE